MALAVIVGLAAVDIVFGRCMDKMLPKISNQGATGKTYFSLHEIDTPIVIVGSSRAAHYYVTPMIAEAFGDTAYNVGRDGCFFTYNCCVVNSILDRYTPKMIVWENSLASLYASGSDPVVNLYPYYWENELISKAIKSKTPWDEPIKLRSGLYRYNYCCSRILIRYATRSNFVDNTIDGYDPLAVKKLQSPLKLEKSESRNGELSRDNMNLFRSTLERAKSKGVRVIVVESPAYRIRPKNDRSAQMMKKICQEEGVEFYDNSQLDQFLQHPEYFKDATHLNDNGARVYTELFLQQIVCK